MGSSHNRDEQVSDYSVIPTCTKSI